MIILLLHQIYISFLVISSSIIFVENTPAQNTIVSGLDKVRINVVKKILLLLWFPSKLRLGIKLILNVPKKEALPQKEEDRYISIL